MNNFFSNIIQKIKNNKKLKIIIIGFLSTLLLFILIFSYIKPENNEKNTNEIDLYVSGLEDRLSTFLSKVECAGKVEVVISIESGMETVLAMENTVKDTEYGSEKSEKPIIVNGKTVVLKELYPKIVGVLIVSEGANNIKVMRKIQEATVSLLNVELNQIEILTMK